MAKTVTNFAIGTASFYLDKIVMHHGLHEAQGRIQNNRDEGKPLLDKIHEMISVTAGKVFNTKTSRVDQIMRGTTKRYENCAAQTDYPNTEDKRR